MPRFLLQAAASVLVVGSLSHRTNKRWDLVGGQELMSLDDHGGKFYGLAFSPDGKILAARGSGTDRKTAEVTFWYGDGASGPGPMKQSAFRR